MTRIKAQEFIVETHDEFVSRVIRLLESGQTVETILMTMNMYILPGSLYDKLALAMIKAKKINGGRYELRFDKNFTNSRVVLPDGHYAMRVSLWDPQNWHKKAAPARITKQNQIDYVDILVDSPSRFHDIPTNGNWARRVLSNHLMQGYAANHAKSGVVKLKDGAELAALLSGEMVSDVKQNNLSLVIKNNPQASMFIEKATNPEAVVGSRGWAEEEIFPHGRLIVDYGNYGEPGQLSRVHDLAETLINPLHTTDAQQGELPSCRPTNIIMVSQYVPTGRLFETLKLASIPEKQGGYGAHVLIPLEPEGDYRRNDFGFALMFRTFMSRKGKYIKTPTLTYPTHVKCLIARYDDDSVSMIFGTDNFDSISDSMYRNTEINLFIDHAKKGDDGYRAVEQTIKKLAEIGDISDTESKKFWR